MVRKITNNIAILDFIQSEPVSDVVKAATYRMFFLSEDNERISNENSYIADSRDQEDVYKRQRQHCNDAELLRPRYFPFRTGGNGTAASQGKTHHRGQAGSCGGKRRGNQGGISSTQNLLLLLLLLSCLLYTSRCV